MNSNEMEFCSSPRTGESNRVRNRRIEVRYLPLQPGIPAFGPTSQETRERAGNPGYSRIRFCLRALGLQILNWKLAEVSGPVRKYSVLRRLSAETGAITTAA